VHPFVGLGKVLAGRGHEVVVHTSEYFRSLVEGAGLTFSGYGTAEDFKRMINNPLLWDASRGYEAVFGAGLCESLRKSYAELKRIVSKETVLVSSSLGVSARVIHDEVGCPGATVHLSPAVIRSSIAPAKLAGLFMPAWLPMFVKKKIWEVGDVKFVDPLICPELNKLRGEVGLKPVARILDGWWNHPERVIGMWPEWYGPRQADWPRQFVHAGFPLYDEGEVTPMSGELLEFLEKGEAPIAFTPGSAMVFGRAFFESAVEACRRLGMRGLLLTRHSEQIPAGLPEDVMHVPYAPFGELLPRCAAIVHHGGIGTTAQGLRAGVPQVVAHFSHDQPDNEYRLRKLGVGTGMSAKKLRGGIGGRRLAKAIGEVLGLRGRCREVAGWVEPGLKRACDAIEGVVVG
jgi:UDP:flavonoid glycosyltransferase YjiC (YdhE family)